jgi:hypothetical protein
VILLSVNIPIARGLFSAKSIASITSSALAIVVPPGCMYVCMYEGVYVCM